MLRAVLDVNVLVSATIMRPGVPGAIMRHWRAGAFELVVSPKLVAELDRVLSEPRIARRVDAGFVAVLRAEIMRDARIVEDPPAERVVPRDPDDDYLVALARAGRAHVIVTGDAHLLEADLRPQAVPPRDFLARLADIP